jgi:hypothetical protein
VGSADDLRALPWIYSGRYLIANSSECRRRDPGAASARARSIGQLDECHRATTGRDLEAGDAHSVLVLVPDLAGHGRKP